MTVVEKPVFDFQRYQELFSVRQNRGVNGLTPEAALERVRAFGLPTRHHELWRYFNTAFFNKTDWHGPVKPLDFELTCHALYQSFAARYTGYIIIFYNGYPWMLPATAAALQAEGVCHWVSPGGTWGGASDVPSTIRWPERYENVMTCLTTGLMTHGFWLAIPPAQVLHQPILFFHINDVADGSAVFPRMQITVGEDSRCDLYEYYQTDSDMLSVPLLDIELAPRAQLRYGKRVRGQAGYHVSQMRIAQYEQSQSVCIYDGEGQSAIRQDIAVRLCGREAQTTWYGMGHAERTQVLDVNMQIEHVASHTRSWQRIHALAEAEGTCTFLGRVIVPRGVTDIKAYEVNRNLVMGANARVNTRPQFEIEADDVVCSHGATVGDLDPHALFYLQSRGFSEQQARELLKRAFVQEIEAILYQDEFLGLFWRAKEYLDAE
ncbi:MAG: hypothetical protein A3J38_10705 [Gammaproteobacteria bacterium RIFCSPHIGHO2_12_FULL_45_9]|nr:MAG: hypothetical protein A3J38_10705 [Gammaproteobacteria bacterium RIFCSPHIGHO2_12_FULL_45_9]